MRFRWINRLERNMYIEKCSAFQSRNLQALKKPIFVFQAFLLITLSNI